VAVPVIVTNDFPPDAGGIQRVMSEIAAAIAANGGTTIVVAPKVAGSDASDRAAPYRVSRYTVFREKIVGMLAMIPPYLGAIRRARDAATVASIWWPSGVAVALVPRFLRGGYVVFAYGSEIMPSKTGFRRLAMRFVYARARAVLAISGYTQQLLANVGTTANVRLIPLGVAATPIAPSRSAAETILSVGRLVARKGFDRTLEAVALLTSEFPALRYVIVGSGPQRDELARRAGELGIADRVTFRGKVTDDELRDAYAQAWVFALPVRRVDDDVEGFGLVYLEAAMARLPSVGGRDSGAVDAIVDGETGFLVDGNDAAAVADALRRALRDPATSLAMGRRAHERALTFTWERTVAEILEALTD
jgi:glycosyltransferase involved in cell wall biosynthesis